FRELREARRIGSAIPGAPLPTRPAGSGPFRFRPQAVDARLAAFGAVAVALARIPRLRAARIWRMEAARAGGDDPRLQADARGIRRRDAHRAARRRARL